MRGARQLERVPGLDVQEDRWRTGEAMANTLPSNPLPPGQKMWAHVHF